MNNIKKRKCNQIIDFIPDLNLSLEDQLDTLSFNKKSKYNNKLTKEFDNIMLSFDQFSNNIIYKLNLLDNKINKINNNIESIRNSHNRECSYIN